MHERDDLRRIERGVGDAHLGNGYRGADEVVAIEIEEGHCQGSLVEGGVEIVPEGRGPDRAPRQSGLGAGGTA